MGRLPDLRPVFYLAMFCFVMAVGLGSSAVVFGLYHLVAAISLYLGS